MNIPVLLPLVFNFPLTYKSEKIQSLKPGDFVEVPFGKEKKIGVVWDKIHETTKSFKLKNVDRKIDKISINKNMIKFINWFSMYNLAPKGLVLKMCISGKKEFYSIKKFEIKDQSNKKNNYNLNTEQSNALKELMKYGNKFHVSVLQGVTGSGKTHVYFERIKKILSQGKQVLVLLPEIFLTNQFQERFLSFFGYEPYIWHSKITPKNKKILWNGIITKKIKLVLGARSSLLLPFNNLGLIIVDEEHDPSYKQEDGIIYNARDMAVARASIENIPIHLVTSIPSIETFNNIKNNKYEVTKINKRYNNYPLPKTKIINLNLKKLKKNFISNEAYEIVEKYLNKDNQVLFFLNRRGYSPFLICKICGFKHSCPNCSIYLTFHKISGNLTCHHCGYKTSIKKKCNDKNNFCDFSMYGPGVEKIYDELKLKFPKKNIKIFSSDYLSKKKESLKIFEEIKKNKIDILVGTQMVSKGFNFPKLNCIVVVDADFTGKGYDLRTTEKNIQLYNQLSGRAGRFASDSIIIYQTVTPKHETLKDLIINNPEKFLENELIVRKENNLPPYKNLVSIIVSSSSKENSLKGAQEIKKKLSILKNLDILGPVDSPIFKINKKFRTRLLIRSKKEVFAQKLISNCLNSLKISSKIKLTVDVDPINFT